jgi:hypothetical protein
MENNAVIISLNTVKRLYKMQYVKQKHHIAGTVP